ARVGQRHLVRIETRLDHQVSHRGRIVCRGYGRKRQSQGYRLATFDQLRRRRAFRIGDEIKRAALVILTPSAPIAELLVQGGHLLRRQTISHLRSSPKGCRPCIAQVPRVDERSVWFEGRNWSENLCVSLPLPGR